MSTRAISRFAAVLCLAALPFLQVACDDDGDNGTTDTVSGDPDASGGEDSTGPGDSAGDDTTGAGACDPITQEGCAAGENCTYADQDATEPSCVQAGGLEPGARCGEDVDGSCTEGICLSLNQTEFRCYTFCETPIHCPDNGDCLNLQDSPYSVCAQEGIYETCDLLAQDCEDGKGCYLVDGEPEPVCLPAGDGDVEDPCDNEAAACKAGLVCVGNGCRRLCDTTAAQPCGDDFTACSSYYQGAGYCDE
ncbi:MAG: hypothetical protein ACQEXJ_16500 [Myxococcota bacterium]